MSSPTSGTPRLRVTGLHAWYGASHVLQGVDLRIDAGEIVGLLGRNGSGRSTVARALLGLVDHRGSIVLDGHELVGLKTFERARRGLGYVPETRDVFPALTVAQNLELGRKSGSRGRWSAAALYALFPALARRAGTRAESLSGGEQQMLALCRAVMGDPALIVVDEPAEGLAPQVVAQLAEFLSTLKAGGTSVLLIEQRLAISLHISDRVQVLGHGKIVFEGSPQALQADEGLRKTWLEI